MLIVNLRVLFSPLACSLLLGVGIAIVCAVSLIGGYGHDTICVPNPNPGHTFTCSQAEKMFLRCERLQGVVEHLEGCPLNATQKCLCEVDHDRFFASGAVWVVFLEFAVFAIEVTNGKKGLGWQLLHIIGWILFGLFVCLAVALSSLSIALGAETPRNGVAIGFGVAFLVLSLLIPALKFFYLRNHLKSTNH